MQVSPTNSSVLRFGAFEFDLRAGELRKQGIRIRLEGQPLAILTMLLDRPGELVTREDLQRRLWPVDTFVDFEHSLNAAVKRLRAALRDSASTPRYIETLASRGYRFVATLQFMPQVPEAPPVVDAGKPAPPAQRVGSAGAALRNWKLGWQDATLFGVILVLAVSGAGYFSHRSSYQEKVSGAPAIYSIAVLPLENLSHDPEQEYFADGITDQLITNLAGIAALRVISRTSVMRYKHTNKSLSEIAQDLHVDAVVEGTVMQAGGRIRVTAQLIEVPTDHHLWAASYERDLHDVLSMQAEVTRGIVSEIRVKLTTQEQARLANTGPVNTEVYQLYLRGRFCWNKRNKDGMKRGLEYFQQAIEKDPTFAPAFSGLSDCYLMLAHYEVLQFEHGLARAKAAAVKAVQLDDRLGEAHTSLAMILANEGESANAEREFKRAIELTPNYATAHHWYSQQLASLGRAADSMAEIKRAQELDPVSLIISSAIGGRYYEAGQYDRAIKQWRETLEMDPQFAQAHLFLQAAYEEMGMFREAIAEYRKGATLLGDESNIIAQRAEALSGAYSHAGPRGYWLTWLQIMKNDLTAKRGFGFGSMAILYARLGDKRRALEWVERTCKRHHRLPRVFLMDPAFDRLRQDSDFEKLTQCRDAYPHIQ